MRLPTACLALVLAPAAALAQLGDGGAMARLQGASLFVPAGSLEAQAEDAGASFTGNAADAPSAVPDYAAGLGLRPSLAALGGPDHAAEPPAGATGLDSLRRGSKPVFSDFDKPTLKRIRLAGAAAAVGGLGWIAFALAAGAAVPVWPLAVVFLGGLAAYLAHQALKEKT